MTPSTWMTILAFFLFVAPGLLFDLLSARKRVKPEETTFTEISRIALVSTLCSGGAFILLGFFKALSELWDWDLLPSLSGMIRHGSAYLADNLTKVSVASGVFVTLSLFASFFAFKVIYRKDPGGLSYTSSWRLVMRKHTPSQASVHVRVELSDGTTWFGRVSDYSADFDIASRELILRPPIAVRQKSDYEKPRTFSIFPDKWQYVVLRGSEIVSMAVSYGQPDNPGNPDATEYSAGAT